MLPSALRDTAAVNRSRTAPVSGPIGVVQISNLTRAVVLHPPEDIPIPATLQERQFFVF